MEHGTCVDEFPIKIVMFNRYLSLPEGTRYKFPFQADSFPKQVHLPAPPPLFGTKSWYAVHGVDAA